MRAGGGDGNSTVVPSVGPMQLTVEAQSSVDLVRGAHLWDLYADAFAKVNPLAAQRHLMTVDEFWAVMTDHRVMKYVAFIDGHPVGLSVMTNDLDAWTLIAPSFFRRTHPGRVIFYIGFVAVRARLQGAFVALIDRMYADVIAADGVAVMDFCGVNADKLRLPERTDMLLRAKNPNARHAMVDRQEFHVWDFRVPE